jgi:hypothetical protein
LLAEEEEIMKETYRKDPKDKGRSSSNTLDLHSLENGASKLNHSFTVNGLNYSESENPDRKVQSKGAFVIPFLIAVW